MFPDRSSVPRGSVRFTRSEEGLLTRDFKTQQVRTPNRPSQGSRLSGFFGNSLSLTVAGPCRNCTGLPHYAQTGFLRAVAMIPRWASRLGPPILLPISRRHRTHGRERRCSLPRHADPSGWHYRVRRNTTRLGSIASRILRGDHPGMPAAWRALWLEEATPTQGIQSPRRTAGRERRRHSIRSSTGSRDNHFCHPANRDPS